jgi:hypothetical protein
MINYSLVKIVYDSPPAPPEGMYMDRIYSIFKINDDIYITDGNAEIKIDEFLLKMVFVPKNNVQWKDVDFSEETKTKK